MGILKNGMRVKEFGFVDVQEKCPISSEHDNVEYITVSMEDGQCSGVPWLVVKFTDRPRVMYNAADLEYIKLFD